MDVSPRSVVVQDDPEAVDAGGDHPPLDLSPRDAPRARRRRWPALVVVGAILAAAGFVATRSLNDATLFFLHADEAIDQREELGDRRFRLHGEVQGESIREVPGGVEFSVAFNGAVVDVTHLGDPPELFQPDMPVVLEGNWASDEVFSSDRMLVRHDEQLEEAHPEVPTGDRNDIGARGQAK